MSATQDAIFVQALRYWYDASGRAALKLGTFSDALDYYRKVSPKFQENFGQAAASVSQSKVKAAMEKLAANFGINFPAYTDFFNYLSISAASWNWDDTAAVATKTVEDIKTTAQIGLGIWAVMVCGVLAFFVFQKMNARKG